MSVKGLLLLLLIFSIHSIDVNVFISCGKSILKKGIDHTDDPRISSCGRTFLESMQKTDTILSLKKKIQEGTRISPKDQKFTFLNCELVNSMTMVDYDIQDGVTIVCFADLDAGLNAFPAPISLYDEKDAQNYLFKGVSTPNVPKVPKGNEIFVKVTCGRWYSTSKNSFVQKSRITSPSCGTTLSISLDNNEIDTISELKPIIAKLTKVKPIDQRLTLGSKVLGDSTFFVEENIKSGTTIDLFADVKASLGEITKGDSVYVRITCQKGAASNYCNDVVKVGIKKKDKILTIKKRLYSVIYVAPDDQILKLKLETTKTLSDSKTVSFYNIKNDFILDCFVKNRESGGKFNIYVDRGTRRYLKVEVDYQENPTIAELKREIESLIRNDSPFNLLFKGTLLVDTKTIRDYGIGVNSVLNLGGVKK